MKANEKRPANESSESRAIIEHAFALARELKIRKILIQADELRDQRWVRQHQQDEILIWLSSSKKTVPQADGRTSYLLELPGPGLSRMDQIQIGLMMAVCQRLVGVDETVATLTGLVGSNRLDNLLIANPRRDHAWLRKHSFSPRQGKLLRSREYFTLLEIALRFAREGREGKSIGTAFVLGDLKALKPYLRQLILNPCQGHPQKARSIHRPDFIETLREWAALDGAFVIDRKGVVERAGAYLAPPPSRRRIHVRKGQGARHTSASAMTAACNALAVVLSESSSSVTVYHRGGVVLELNQRR
jgi:DNA integrity scanning protein DisA with diadenylate cyclase activity